MQRPATGIPPVAFEPELPVLPTLHPDEVSPMQLAKVMPQELATVEITTETLEVALSDIYFDYDQFAIREEAAELLEINAQLFAAKFAEKNIVIEGHCDERGTQSYNMVLGERRAKAVKHFLQDLGVPAENLQVVSYGKDKPFCLEQTEACWQENRRGHFVIK
jgi:peptidoglycan-associated lipoprotein